MGSKSTITKSNTSKPIKQKTLNDYKYAIGTVKQADNYNKITNYLIVHIRNTYKNGGDTTDTIEKQEHFHFNSSVPKLKILTTVKIADTSAEEKLEIKHENDQYEAELQSKKVIITPTWGKHTHSYLGNAQQAYSIE